MNQATCQPVHSPNVSVESRFTINNVMQQTHQMMHVTHPIDHSTQNRENKRQESEHTRQLHAMYRWTRRQLLEVQKHSMSSTSCVTGVSEQHSAFVNVRYASTAARLPEHCWLLIQFFIRPAVAGPQEVHKEVLIHDLVGHRLDMRKLNFYIWNPSFLWIGFLSCVLWVSLQAFVSHFYSLDALGGLFTCISRSPYRHQEVSLQKQKVVCLDYCVWKLR